MFVQVADILERCIAEGALKAGAKLPTESELAEEFGFTETTAHRVAEELRERKLIHTVWGKGSFVGPEGTPRAVVAPSLPRRVADQIIELIGAGTFPVGERLEGLRLLEARFGVSKATVVAAVAILRQEGWVTIMGRKGTYVLRRSVTDAGIAASDLVTGGRRWRSTAEELAARSAARSAGGVLGVGWPVYSEVVRVLEQRIAERVYPPGGALPGEEDLAREFKIAVATVRRAVKELRGRRLIHTVAGRGSFVGLEGTVTVTARDDRRGRQQVADDLARRIAAGEFAEGKLPTRRELMAHYRVSVNTVTMTMKILRERKLVLTFQGSGTFVASDLGTGEQTPADRVRSSALRYVQIADAIAQRIADGDLVLGDRLPSEEEVMRQFAVPRLTARKAYRELRNRNLIHTVRDVGSFVGPEGTPRSARSYQPRSRVKQTAGQIAGLIAARIQARALAPGAKLSRVALARDYQVHTSTIRSALEELRGQGWALKTPGGTVVNAEAGWPGVESGALS